MVREEEEEEEEEEAVVVVTAKEAEEGTDGRGLIRLAGSMKAWLPPSTHAVRSRPTKGTCRCRRMLLMVPLLLLLLLCVVVCSLLLPQWKLAPALATRTPPRAGYVREGKALSSPLCADGVGRRKDGYKCK